MLEKRYEEKQGATKRSFLSPATLQKSEIALRICAKIAGESVFIIRAIFKKGGAMTAQHKRAGRTAKRNRQQRVLGVLMNQRDRLDSIRNGMSYTEFHQRWGNEYRRIDWEIKSLQSALRTQ
jgi:CRISPR/Cas system Type II protein with McrA/HNH and RuvC-like nuclease domain